jgi:hypothetical protein
MDQKTTCPFTRREGLAAGLTADELAGPRYQRLFHGLYLPAHVRVTVVERARAALKICPEGTFASHHTAAAVWGGWVPETAEICAIPSSGSSSSTTALTTRRTPDNGAATS